MWPKLGRKKLQHTVAVPVVVEPVGHPAHADAGSTRPMLADAPLRCIGVGHPAAVAVAVAVGSSILVVAFWFDQPNWKQLQGLKKALFCWN